ncbi:MAG: TlpA disulfide reductase family protein [Acidobacteriota bacterium]
MTIGGGRAWRRLATAMGLLCTAARMVGVAAAQQVPSINVTVADGLRKDGLGYYPVQLLLESHPPAGVVKLPDLDRSAVFGVLRFGPKDEETTYVLVLSEPEGKPAALYFDANRNGDLTDDPPVAWPSKPYKGGTEEKPIDLTQWEGTTSVELPHLGRLTLGLYRFDPKDANRARLAGSLLYYLDYGLSGTATLNGKAYKVLVRDRHSSADFSRLSSPGGLDYPLLIDVNGDGKFTAGKAEYRDARKPFNIAGTTYEFTGWSVTGAGLSVVTSAQTAEEIPPPPVQVASANGSVFPPVVGKAVGGEQVDFPAGYRGKIVLVDFWATWCGPCLEEAPNVVKAFAVHHGNGFEIIGVSLDQPGQEAKVKEVAAKHGLAWPHLYDGKGFETRQVQQLAIKGIPATFLVDGDTGIIIAQGEEIRGDKLAPAVEKALAGRKGDR